MTRALITNDDGIASEGLRHLALAAHRAGLDVVVAAPQHESSGASASLNAIEADGRIVIEEHHLEGLDGVPAYGVAATPGFIALIATRGGFGGGPPDVILSGINRGANIGNAIIHSGTVGATITAAAHGCRALAVSLASAAPKHWETAAAAAEQALELLMADGPHLVLNLNVPDIPTADLRGLCRAHLARFGAVQTTIAETGHGYVKLAIEDETATGEPGTDAAIVASGYAAVTPLQPLCERQDASLPGLAMPDSVAVSGR